MGRVFASGYDRLSVVGLSRAVATWRVVVFAAFHFPTVLRVVVLRSASLRTDFDKLPQE